MVLCGLINGQSLMTWRGLKKLVSGLTVILCVTAIGCERGDLVYSATSQMIPAPQISFSEFLQNLWPEAKARGVSKIIFDHAIYGLTPDYEVIRAAENQPEFTRPVWDYIEKAVSDSRLKTARKKLAEQRSVLANIEKRFGVDRHVVVAIWGLESGFGNFVGSKNVIRSLATIAYMGQRKKFGREQFLAALEILEHGDIGAEMMIGSWAGAMGQTQFIPSTYNNHAIDFDGDGRRDIWHSIADALGSTANYLAVSNWQTGQPWFYEVNLPAGFDYALADTTIKQTTEHWRGLGVARADGGALPDALEAAVIVPAGHKGPAFMVFANHHAIMKYNNSTSYALAVGYLAKRMHGAGEFIQAWPVDDEPLTRTEKEQLQRLLSDRGFDTMGVDGLVGPRTRSALRQWQKSQGLPADGYPTQNILSRLEAGN